MLGSRLTTGWCVRIIDGYYSCAQEAASFLLSTPGVDVRISQKLLSHLSTNTMGGPRAATPFGPVHSPLPPSFPMTPPSSHSMSLMPSSNTSNLDQNRAIKPLTAINN